MRTSAKRSSSFRLSDSEVRSKSKRGPLRIEFLEARVVLSGFTLLDSSFFGGSGDQRATAIDVNGNDIYMAVNANESHSSSANSFLLKYSAPTAPNSQPSFSKAWSFGNFSGLAATDDTVYAAGSSHPGAGLTSDGTGGAEIKTLLMSFDANNSPGPGPGGSNWATAIPPGTFNSGPGTSFFSYNGVESYTDTITVEEGTNRFIYASGAVQPCSHTTFVVSKSDTTGNIIGAATASGVAFTTCSAPSTAMGAAFGLVELNGDIYVAGGLNDSVGSSHPTVWKYDTSLNLQSQSQDATTSGSFAGIATDGTSIYAVGTAGADSDFLIAKYDQAGNQLWKSISGSVGKAEALRDVTVVNGRLFAVGHTNAVGAGGEDMIVIEVDPTTGDMIDSDTFGGAMNDRANRLASNGTDLFVVGESRSFTEGGNQSGQNDAVLLRYGLGDQAGIWKIEPDLTQGVGFNPHVEAIGGLLYVAGGNDGAGGVTTLQVFDPVTSTWSAGASMLGRRYDGASAVVDSKLYVAGGWNPPDSFVPTATLQIYDPQTNSWSFGPTIPGTVSPPLGLSACSVGEAIGDTFYLLSACNGFSGVFKAFGAFDTTTNQWADLPDPAFVHSDGSVGVIDGKLYVAGGYDGSTQSTALEMYDPATNSWTTLAPMPTARSTGGGAVLNGRFYVIGGGDGNSELDVVESYNPLTNTWKTEPSLNTTRMFLDAATLGGTIYAVGGFESNIPQTTVESYRLNRPELANVSLTPIVNENGIVSLEGEVLHSGNLDEMTLLVDWGDPLSANNSQSFRLGSSVLTKALDGLDWDPANRQFSVDHRFLDDNPNATEEDDYTVEVSLLDDSNQATALKVTIKNVPPQLESLLATTSNNQDELVTLTGTFTDPGERDSHTVRTDWGDGTVDIITLDIGDRDLSIDHEYSVDTSCSGSGTRNYTIESTINDDDSVQTTSTLSIVHQVRSRPGSNCGQIEGVVLHDADGDGVLVGNEQGLGGFKVFVDDNNNGKHDSGETFSFSTNTGQYTLSELAAGFHIWRVELKDDWRVTNPPGDGGNSGTLPNGGTLSGDSQNFGLNKSNGVIPRSISGRIVNDQNGDGVLSGNEPGLANWVVYIDLNNNAKHDAGEKTATSSQDGTYVVSDVDPGFYIWRVLVQSGWTQTNPAGDGGNSGTLPAGGGALVGQDFGVTQNRGTIRGLVFEDLDENGLRGLSEPVMPRVTIVVDVQGGGQQAITRTNKNGIFQIRDLVPATYIVTESVPLGYRQTNPVSGNYTFTLVGGQLKRGLTFGNVWDVRQYELTVNKEGSGTGLVITRRPSSGIRCGPDCSHVYDEATQVRLRAIPRNGSIFVGWQGAGCSGTGTCVVTMNSDVSVKAIFESPNYNLNVEKKGSGVVRTIPRDGGIVCGTDCSESYPKGTKVTLLARPRPGWEFLGWEGEACGAAEICRITISQDTDVTAVFVRPTFELDVTKKGRGVVKSIPQTDGILCGQDCSETFSQGTKVTLLARPQNGWVFDRWVGIGCGTEETCRITINQDVTATAVFIKNTEQFTLTVTKEGRGVVRSLPRGTGITCGKFCSSTYDDQTTVTLNAEPRDGWTFVRWISPGCGTDNQCEVTMNDNKNVTAKFSPNGGGGGGSNQGKSGQLLVDYTVATGGQTVNGTLTFQKLCQVSANGQVPGAYHLESDSGGLVTVHNDTIQTVSDSLILFTTQGPIGSFGSGQFAITVDGKNVNGLQSTTNFIRATNGTVYQGRVTDGAFTPCSTLRAAMSEASRQEPLNKLSDKSLQLIVSAVRRRSDLSERQIRLLDQTQFQIVDLPDSILGLTTDHLVSIDRDAAGLGWFVDPTPLVDEEFIPNKRSRIQYAAEGGAAAEGIDLYTVVAHEIGHVLGKDDLDPMRHFDDVMADTLERGTRRLAKDKAIGQMVDRFRQAIMSS